jgi:hypothetical protein
VSLDRTERTGLPGHDSNIKRAVDKGVWAEQLDQDSWDRAAGTGQLGQNGREMTARQDSWCGDSLDRTTGTRQQGQNSRDRTNKTGKLGQENWDRKVGKTDRIVQPE